MEQTRKELEYSNKCITEANEKLKKEVEDGKRNNSSLSKLLHEAR